MEISAIIVNYKSEKFLEKCLKSLAKNINEVSFEIIIVNNGPDDFEFLKKISEKYNANLINSKKNIGFGSACNWGAKNAIGKFLFFINPDAQIMSPLRKTLREIKKLKADIAGGNLLDISEKPQKFSCGSFFTLKTLFFNKYLSKINTPWLSRLPIEVDWVSGGSMIIKKDLFKKLNGFDNEYFMYLEDQDLCCRAKMTNSKIMFFPEFLIKHNNDYRMSKSKLKSYNKSLSIYFKKHNNLLENILLKIIKPVYDSIKYGQNLKN